MARIIAVTGISGVGKTTFLTALRPHCSFQHLQASALIQSQHDQSCASANKGAIAQNQDKLITAFNLARDPKANLVVIDGHTIIDTPDGLVRISAGVFRALEVSAIFYLYDAPAPISMRRACDTTRVRPQRSLQDLARQQKLGLLHGLRVAQSLGIPIHILTPHQDVAFERWAKKPPIIRGFSLIESAIVLAVVGLVIGGIWVAAASVSENWKVEETIQGIFSTVKNIQRNVSINDGLTIGGGGVDITNSIIAMGGFPADWVQNGQIKTPLNGSIRVQNYAGGNDSRFDFVVTGVPRSSCIKLAVRITTLAAQVQSQGIGSYKDTLGYIYVNASLNTSVFPVTIAQATAACATTNNMYFTFGYSRVN